MAVTWLNAGGDETFDIKLWQNLTGGVAVATDHVHGGHSHSLKARAAQHDVVGAPNGTIADAGTRFSLWVYLVALPTATASFVEFYNTSVGVRAGLRLTSAGVLQAWSSTAQVGSNGPTLSTGQWYQISGGYTISSSTVNRFEIFVNNVSAISLTNVTLSGTGTNRFDVGNISTDTTLDFRWSDVYLDNSSSLTDPGAIWCTAKRPIANGTTNDFTTQIGAGGSGSGTGHSPQVNERALSTTNGWSMVGAGSAVTEEYTAESASAGDIDISAKTIIDYMGWVYAKSLASETAQIIVGGATSNIALTSTITMFQKMAGSSTYPAGGTDIGIITDTSLTTVSLYEAGLVVAYKTPSAATPVSKGILIG